MLRYFLITDGDYTHISNDPNDERIADKSFSSFYKAKAALIEYHKNRVDSARYFLKQARALKEAKECECKNGKNK